MATWKVKEYVCEKSIGSGQIFEQTRREWLDKETSKFLYHGYSVSDANRGIKYK